MFDFDNLLIIKLNNDSRMINLVIFIIFADMLIKSTWHDNNILKPTVMTNILEVH